MKTFKESCKEFLSSMNGQNCSNCVYGQTVYTLDEINTPNQFFEYIPNVYYCLQEKKLHGAKHTCKNFINIYEHEN